MKKYIILSALILSGCATVQDITPMSALSDQNKVEIMEDIAGHYGVEPLPPPRIKVHHHLNPRAVCWVNPTVKYTNWVHCKREPSAHIFYHESVHVYQFVYDLPIPIGTGCKRPREFDAYILTSNWCQRVGGCPAMITNPTDEFLKERAECQE